MSEDQSTPPESEQEHENGERLSVTAEDLMVRFKNDTQDAVKSIRRIDEGIAAFAKEAGNLGVGFLSMSIAADAFAEQMVRVNQMASEVEEEE